MKLISIRLHPFGASIDRTFTWGDGLNVLEGPNEFGKSTLSHALWHALFSPSNMTPVKLEKTMGRWYPKPNGDHVRITLRFSADGRTWTLGKTWGAGSSSHLQVDGGASMAQPAAVQAELLRLLRRNEATWGRVLFTGQAQLTRTIAKLREEGHSLDDVHGLLAGAAAIPGDIAPDKLLGGINDRINAHFGRWDITARGPEGGRGLARMWANKVGPVLKAFYEKETLRAELNRVVSHERAVDGVNERIARLQDDAGKDAAFIAEGRALRLGLGQRTGLEERVARLTGSVEQLMKITTDWPGAEQVISAKEQELTRMKNTLDHVDTELANARRQAQAQTVREGYKRLTEARTAWEDARRRLDEQPAVDPRALDELRQLETRMVELGIRMEAQKLAALLESSDDRTVTIQRGTGAPENVTLAPDSPWEGAAAGRLTVEVGSVRLTVRSGQEDVDALIAQLNTAEHRRTELLAAMGRNSLAEAETAAKAHEEQLRSVKSKADLHLAALQGRTAEEWEAEVQALSQLPATRDIAVLEQEQNSLRDIRSKLEAEVEAKRHEVAQWQQAHVSVAKLVEKVMAEREELKAAEQQLAGLPALPAGHATVNGYLRLLTDREDAQETSRGQLEAARQELARLEGGTPTRTAEDLSAELDLKEREFQRRLAEGQALLRIRDTLETVIAQRGNDDPLQGLTDAIAHRFNALTNGRYTGVTLDGLTPAQVTGHATLSSDLLSQGALGSLALAARLALAELYLREDNGFLLLDDPFTDMDPERRSLAMAALVDFAAHHQVILLTCHTGHAEELVHLGAHRARVV